MSLELEIEKRNRILDEIKQKNDIISGESNKDLKNKISNAKSERLNILNKFIEKQEELRREQDPNKLLSLHKELQQLCKDLEDADRNIKNLEDELNAAVKKESSKSTEQQNKELDALLKKLADSTEKVSAERENKRKNAEQEAKNNKWKGLNLNLNMKEIPEYQKVIIDDAFGIYIEYPKRAVISTTLKCFFGGGVKTIPEDYQFSADQIMASMSDIKIPGLATLLNMFIDTLLKAIGQGFVKNFFFFKNTIDMLAGLQLGELLGTYIPGIPKIIQDIQLLITNPPKWMMKKMLGPLFDIGIPIPCFTFNLGDLIPFLPFKVKIPKIDPYGFYDKMTPFNAGIDPTEIPEDWYEQMQAETSKMEEETERNFKDIKNKKLRELEKQRQELQRDINKENKFTKDRLKIERNIQLEMLKYEQLKSQIEHNTNSNNISNGKLTNSDIVELDIKFKQNCDALNELNKQLENILNLEKKEQIRLDNLDTDSLKKTLDDINNQIKDLTEQENAPLKEFKKRAMQLIYEQGVTDDQDTLVTKLSVLWNNGVNIFDNDVTEFLQKIGYSYSDNKYLYRLKSLRRIYGFEFNDAKILSRLYELGFNLNDTEYLTKLNILKTKYKIDVKNTELMYIMIQLGFNFSNVHNFKFGIFRTLDALITLNIPIDKDFLEKLRQMGFNFNNPNAIKRLTSIGQYLDLKDINSFNNALAKNVNLNNPYFEEVLKRTSKIGLVWNDGNFLDTEKEILENVKVEDIDYLLSVIKIFKNKDGRLSTFKFVSDYSGDDANLEHYNDVMKKFSIVNDDKTKNKNIKPTLRTLYNGESPNKLVQDGTDLFYLNNEMYFLNPEIDIVNGFNSCVGDGSWDLNSNKATLDKGYKKIKSVENDGGKACIVIDGIINPVNTGDKCIIQDCSVSTYNGEWDVIDVSLLSITDAKITINKTFTSAVNLTGKLYNKKHDSDNKISVFGQKFSNLKPYRVSYVVNNSLSATTHNINMDNTPTVLNVGNGTFNNFIVNEQNSKYGIFEIVLNDAPIGTTITDFKIYSYPEKLMWFDLFDKKINLNRFSKYGLKMCVPTQVYSTSIKPEDKTIREIPVLYDVNGNPVNEKCQLTTSKKNIPKRNYLYPNNNFDYTETDTAVILENDTNNDIPPKNIIKSKPEIEVKLELLRDFVIHKGWVINGIKISDNVGEMDYKDILKAGGDNNLKAVDTSSPNENEVSFDQIQGIYGNFDKLGLNIRDPKFQDKVKNLTSNFKLKMDESVLVDTKKLVEMTYNTQAKDSNKNDIYRTINLETTKVDPDIFTEEKYNASIKMTNIPVDPNQLVNNRQPTKTIVQFDSLNKLGFNFQKETDDDTYIKEINALNGLSFNISQYETANITDSLCSLGWHFNCPNSYGNKDAKLNYLSTYMGFSFLIPVEETDNRTVDQLADSKSEYKSGPDMYNKLNSLTYFGFNFNNNEWKTMINEMNSIKLILSNDSFSDQITSLIGFGISFRDSDWRLKFQKLKMLGVNFGTKDWSETMANLETMGVDFTGSNWMNNFNKAMDVKKLGFDFTKSDIGKKLDILNKLGVDLSGGKKSCMKSPKNKKNKDKNSKSANEKKAQKQRDLNNKLSALNAVLAVKNGNPDLINVNKSDNNKLKNQQTNNQDKINSLKESLKNAKSEAEVKAIQQELNNTCLLINDLQNQIKSNNSNLKSAMNKTEDDLNYDKMLLNEQLVNLDNEFKDYEIPDNEVTPDASKTKCGGSVMSTYFTDPEKEKIEAMVNLGLFEIPENAQQKKIKYTKDRNEKIEKNAKNIQEIEDILSGKKISDINESILKLIKLQNTLVKDIAYLKSIDISNSTEMQIKGVSDELSSKCELLKKVSDDLNKMMSEKDKYNNNYDKNLYEYKLSVLNEEKESLNVNNVGDFNDNLKMADLDKFEGLSELGINFNDPNWKCNIDKIKGFNFNLPDWKNKIKDFKDLVPKNPILEWIKSLTQAIISIITMPIKVLVGLIKAFLNLIKKVLSIPLNPLKIPKWAKGIIKAFKDLIKMITSLPTIDGLLNFLFMGTGTLDLMLIDIVVPGFAAFAQKLKQIVKEYKDKANKIRDEIKNKKILLNKRKKDKDKRKKELTAEIASVDDAINAKKGSNNLNNKVKSENQKLENQKVVCASNIEFLKLTVKNTTMLPVSLKVIQDELDKNCKAIEDLNNDIKNNNKMAKDALDKPLNELENDKKKLNEQLANLDDVIDTDSLERDINNLDSAAAEEEDKADKLGNFCKWKDNMDKIIEILRGLMDFEKNKKNPYEDEVNSNNDKLDKLKKLIDNINKNIKNLEDSKSSDKGLSNNANNDLLKDLYDRIDALKKQIKDLEEYICENRTKMNDKEFADKLFELEMLRKELDDLLKELNDTSKIDNDINSLKVSVKKLQDELDKLKNSNDKLKENQDNFDKAKNKSLLELDGVAKWFGVIINILCCTIKFVVNIFVGLLNAIGHMNNLPSLWEFPLIE